MEVKFSIKPILDAVKKYWIGLVLVSLTGSMITIWQTEKGLHEYYERKQNSHAVGLRVDNEGRITYKTTDREVYPAYYLEDIEAYYYTDKDGEEHECH